MNITCIIPARLGSSRLQNKMLADIQGKPLIVRTYEQAIQCELFSRVIVATDSDRIGSLVDEAGGEVMMPEGHFETGSERVAAAANNCPEADVVVNLQGDEPFIQPAMLCQLVQPFYEANPPQMATLACTLDWQRDYENASHVKVLVDQHGDAIYFSRSPIPYLRAQVDYLPVYHHIGLYAYQKDCLLTLASWPQTALEKVELLEQLRALENGIKIRVSTTHHKHLEINTPEDLEAAQNMSVIHR